MSDGNTFAAVSGTIQQEQVTGSRILRRYTTFIVENRVIVIVLVMAVTVVLAIGVSRLHLEIDPDRSLPQDHPYIQALNELHRLFGDKNLVVLGLIPRDGHVFTPEFLSKAQQVTRSLETIPGVVKPLLQGVASAAMKDVQPIEGGIRVDRLMDAVPTTQAEADAIRARLFANSSFVGTLVSPDASALAIYATFELTRDLPGYVNLHEAVLDKLRAADDGTFTYALAGPVVIVSTLTRYSRQMAYLFPIALVVIAAVHYEAFGTLQATFLPLLTALLSVVWAVGLMGLLSVPLDSFNSTTPILILAVAAGHAVQILKRYYEELTRLRDNKMAVIESISQIGGVMIAAATIAALSFLSLLTFGTQSIRIFGVFTALGIVSTLIIELTLIPVVRAVLPEPRVAERELEARKHPWLDAGLGRLSVVVTGKRAPMVVMCSLAVIALSAIVASRIEVDTSFKRHLAPSETALKDDNLLNGLFAGTNVLVFLVKGPDEGSIAEPAALRAIDHFERRMEALDGVGKATSVVDTLKRLHRAMRNVDDAGELPTSKALASQYLFLYSLSGGDDLDTQITADYRVAKVVVLMHNDSTQYGRMMIERAKRILDEEMPIGYEVAISGSLASDGALTETMVSGKVRNIIQIGIFTVVIASVLLRSVLGGALVAVPLACAVAIISFVMGALKIPLDIGTAAIAAMAVGIGADYAVYYLFRLREEYALAEGDIEQATARTMATSGKAIVFVSSAIALGYSTLCLSSFRLYVQLGGLVGLAMVTSSLATLIILGSLAALAARTRWSANLLGRAHVKEVVERAVGTRVR